MEINLQVGASLPQALPSARSADTPVVKIATDSVPAPRVPDSQASIQIDRVDPEQKRVEQLAQVAQNFFKNVYAVSDTTFTIFKDQSGQYITRFTSLRDGKVTYIPEPDILRYLDEKEHERQALIELRV